MMMHEDGTGGKNTVKGITYNIIAVDNDSTNGKNYVKAHYSASRMHH